MNHRDSDILLKCFPLNRSGSWESLNDADTKLPGTDINKRCCALIDSSSIYYTI